MRDFKFGMCGQLNGESLSKYQDCLCRIVLEKKNKSKPKHECLFCKIKNVSGNKVFLTDEKGTTYNVLLQSIQSIWINEEQW